MKRVLLFLLVEVFLLAAAKPALATLGGPESSVDNDAQVFKGSRKKSETADYTVHEITLSNGTSIKEYLSHSGVIFAITWQGFTSPDLSLLLGSFYTEYASTVASTPSRKGGRRHSEISTSKIKVSKSGQ